MFLMFCYVMLCRHQALSSSLWCVSVSNGGSLVLDCGSEKLQWLAALNPWVTESPSRNGRIRSNTANIQPVKQSPVKMDSPSDSNGRVQKMSVTLGSAAAMIGALSMASLEEIGGTGSTGMAGVTANAKKLQNATTDMMRAFAVRSALPSSFSATSKSINSGIKSKILSYQPGPVEATTSNKDNQCMGTNSNDSVVVRYNNGKCNTQDVVIRSSAQSSDTTTSLSSPSGGENERISSSEKNSDESTVAQDQKEKEVDSGSVLSLLDAISAPLSHAASSLEKSLDLHVQLNGQATACLNAALREVAQSLVGVGVLRSIADEVWMRILDAISFILIIFKGDNLQSPKVLRCYTNEITSILSFKTSDLLIASLTYLYSFMYNLSYHHISVISCHIISSHSISTFSSHPISFHHYMPHYFLTYPKVLEADEYRSQLCVLSTKSARNQVRQLGEEVVRLNVST